MVVVTCILPSTPVLPISAPTPHNDHYIWYLSFLFCFSYVYCKCILSITHYCCCSVAQPCPQSMWPHGLQHARLPSPSLSLGACSYLHLLSRWHQPTIPSCHLLLLLPSFLPKIKVFSNESTLCIKWPKHININFKNDT